MVRYEYDKKYIDGKKLLFYIVLQWHRILILALLFGIVFFGRRFYLQQRQVSENKTLYPDGYKEKRISLTDTQKANVQYYLTTETAMQKQQEYNQNSLYMQQDPDKIQTLYTYIGYSCDSAWDEKTGQYTDTADVDEAKTKLNRALNSGDTFQYLAEHLSVETTAEYVKEMIWTDAGTDHCLLFAVHMPTEELNRETAELLWTYIRETLNPPLKKLCGDYSIFIDQQYMLSERDGDVASTQANYRSIASNYASALTQLEASFGKREKIYIKKYKEMAEEGQTISPGDDITYTKTVSLGVSWRKIVKAGVKGAALGAALGFAIAFFSFVFSPYMWSRHAFRDTFGVPLLGAAALWSMGERPQTRWNGRLWKSYVQREFGTEGRDVDILSAKLRRYMRQGTDILLVSNSFAACPKELCELMENSGAPNGAQATFVTGADLLRADMYSEKSPEEMKIVFAEIVGKCPYRAFGETLSALEADDDRILGVVAFE